MGIFSKKEPEKKTVYGKIKIAAKLCSPILKALYYIFIVCVLLVGIIAFIMLFVNTKAEEMMLPPFMSVHGQEYYSITIGNGICVHAPYLDVTTGDIKTVVYAELMMLAAVLCILAPTVLFLSKLFKNIAGDRECELKNARYISYIGLTVMVGSTFVRVFRSIYNFLLVKTFVSDPTQIRFSFEVDLGGIAVGVLILIFAALYGHVCEKYANTALVTTEETEEE